MSSERYTPPPNPIDVLRDQVRQEQAARQAEAAASSAELGRLGNQLSEVSGEVRRLEALRDGDRVRHAEELGRTQATLEATRAGIATVREEAHALADRAERRTGEAIAASEARQASAMDAEARRADAALARETARLDDAVRRERERAAAALAEEVARADAALRAEAARREADVAALDQRIEAEAARAAAAIAEVDAKVDAVREDLARRDREALADARALVNDARARIATERETAGDLELEATITLATEALRHAEDEVAHGRGDAAAAAAAGAHAAAVSAQIEAARRRGRMRGAATALRATLDEARAHLASLERLFPKDVARARELAASLEATSRRWDRLRAYTAFRAEQEHEQEVANELAFRARLLATHAPAIEAQIARRNQIVLDDLRPSVSRALGGLVDAGGWSYGPSNKDEPTGPARLAARSGRSSVEAFVDLDGGSRVVTHGSATHVECESLARRVDEAFRVPRGRTTLHYDEAGAATATPPAAPTTAWRPVRDALRALVSRRAGAGAEHG